MLFAFDQPFKGQNSNMHGRLWKDTDGSYWFKGRWYVIPEETAVGRQPHNLRRELFRTNHCDKNEVG